MTDGVVLGDAALGRGQRIDTGDDAPSWTDAGPDELRVRVVGERSRLPDLLVLGARAGEPR